MSATTITRTTIISRQDKQRNERKDAIQSNKILPIHLPLNRLPFLRSGHNLLHDTLHTHHPPPKLRPARNDSGITRLRHRTRRRTRHTLLPLPPRPDDTNRSNVRHVHHGGVLFLAAVLLELGHGPCLWGLALVSRRDVLSRLDRSVRGERESDDMVGLYERVVVEWDIGGVCRWWSGNEFDGECDLDGIVLCGGGVDGSVRCGALVLL
mmetsp:Transcript_2335/g.3049  ORF Transcript_2335/g.3049 Transcript_2335/m.3049 type:complete len:209 (+) Transcript_2335:150-776(+)